MTPSVHVIYGADYLGCFGNFTRSDPICRKYCALNIRCAIEREENARLEWLEDLAASNDRPPRLQ